MLSISRIQSRRRKQSRCGLRVLLMELAAEIRFTDKLCIRLPLQRPSERPKMGQRRPGSDARPMVSRHCNIRRLNSPLLPERRPKTVYDYVLYQQPTYNKNRHRLRRLGQLFQWRSRRLQDLPARTLRSRDKPDHYCDYDYNYVYDFDYVGA